MAKRAKQEESGKGEESKVVQDGRKMLFVPPKDKKIMRVTLVGKLLVAKPVPFSLAEDLSPFSEIPPKYMKKKEDEKKQMAKRERDLWLKYRGEKGKRTYYNETLKMLKLSNNGGHGVPAATIAKALFSANEIMPGYKIDDRVLKVAIKVLPHDPLTGLVKVSARPFMKQDVVRVGHNGDKPKGTPSLAVRPAWLEWKIANLEVLFVANLIQEEHVVDLFNWAGECGICEGRPSQGSALGWGTFDAFKTGKVDIYRASM